VPRWTVENRSRYDRSTLRYPSDLTDQEWGLIKPLIPPAKRGGRKRTVNARDRQWHLPPRSTLHDYLDRWSYDGTLELIHHALREMPRASRARSQSQRLRDR